jgi:hypothetical protein
MKVKVVWVFYVVAIGWAGAVTCLEAMALAKLDEEQREELAPVPPLLWACAGMNAFGCLCAVGLALRRLLFVPTSTAIALRGSRLTGAVGFAFVLCQLVLHALLVAGLFLAPVRPTASAPVWRCVLLELASFAGIALLALTVVLLGCATNCIRNNKEIEVEEEEASV